MFRDAPGGWVLAGYHGTGNVVSFQAKGTGGIEELKQHLTEDAFFYALIRVANDKELEHSNKQTFRDIYFAFQGPAVSIMKRGKFVEHAGAVEQKFQPNHAQLVVKSIPALTEAALKQKSDPKAGSHIIE